MFEQYLKDIGLSDKEAVVYLSLLNKGDASVADIAKSTKIKRPTVYTILDSLAKKGLSSESTISNKVRYQAEPPERLERFIERQRAILQEKSQMLQAVIPELKALQRESSDKPVVKYYEGKEGLVSSLEEIFETKDKNEDSVYFIYPKDKVDEIWAVEDRKVYKNRRLLSGLKSKAIYTWEKSEIPEGQGNGSRLKIDLTKYPIKADIAIYGDKVKIHTLTERLSGIFIQNKDVADTLKSLINYMLDNKK